MTKRDATTRTGRRQTRARGRRLLGGYRRVSDVGRREADERLRSPEFQADLIDGRAGAEGVDVRMYEPELDVSGSKRERVILDSIVEAIEAGELDGIVVAKLDRLSRLKPLERIELVERIEAAGGVILSASEAFDTSTPEGRFVRELFFSIARLEWERFAGNWQTARRNAVESGVVPNGRRPFGYRFDRDHRLVVDREEAAIVRELFELRADGASWTTLLETFEERTGRSTARQTMSVLTRRRTYLGEIAHGELVNVAGCEPIVELDLFERVQAVNAKRAGDGAGLRHAGAPVSMLGGVATCRGCRRPMTSHAKRDRARRYECPSPASQCSERASILADDLDAFVWDRVLEWAGPAADELVELEVELDASGDRIVAEHRLAEAERLALAYETDVELELEIGREAFAAGRRARLDVVELRREELAAIGEASEHELARTTLRQAVESGELEVEESRRLLKIVLAGVVVRRAGRGVAMEERAELRYTLPLVEDAAADASSEELVELGQEVAAA
jgi:DNA invertase Pin-like site-specific DNA recombinase